jgi:hypothetical protein
MNFPHKVLITAPDISVSVAVYQTLNQFRPYSWTNLLQDGKQQPDRTLSGQYSIFVFRGFYVQKLDPEADYTD